MPLTGTRNYFEDFAPGQVFHHDRGRTMTEMDNVLITHLSTNTAASHFDLEYMKRFAFGSFPERLVNGTVTISLVVGLTSQDISENAVADLGYTGIRLSTPMFHGNSLRAESEILKVEDYSARPDCGLVHYRFRGFNEKGQEVVVGERTILVKKRQHWAERDKD
jgi:acyl dehydratase